jgi:hypothetical protein
MRSAGIYLIGKLAFGVEQEMANALLRLVVMPLSFANVTCGIKVVLDGHSTSTAHFHGECVIRYANVYD